MDTATNASDTIASNQSKFLRPIFVILLVHLVSKYSQYAVHGALPLYFVEKLKFDENEATMAFHILGIILYSFSLIGGIVADSVFGMYTILLHSLFLTALGLILLTVTTVPSFHLPLHTLTFVALCIVNIGDGAKSTCIYSFGGDQFLLPQQKKQLSLFFVQIYAASVLALVLSYFISPILRKDIKCFGELSCYSLGFVVPVVVVLIGLGTFLATRKSFRIRKTQDNIAIKIVKCIRYALLKKLTSSEKKKHLLDYATDKYGTQIVEDIRSAFQTLKLIVPTFMLSALSGAEGTTMVFQASRMNGEVAGYLIKPDQILLVQHVFSMFALVALHYYIYPFLAKFFHVNTPLKKITIGLVIAALSYYVATIVEFNLENSYAPKPMKNSAHLRIYNTVNCKATMVIDEHKITIDQLSMWESLNVAVTNKKVFKYSANFEGCRWQHYLKKYSGSFEVLEKQANSLVLTEHGLNYKFFDHTDKSLTGNPLVRALMYTSTDLIEQNNTVKITMKEELLNEIRLSKNITRSDYFEVVHGTYDIYLNEQKVQSNVPLKNGGVYTILGSNSNLSKVARVITVTPPNSMHMFWILPQQIMLITAIVIFNPICSDFLYSQGPPSMKASVQSFSIVSMGVGHFIVVLITYANFFERKVFVFLLYAVLMTIATIIFVLLAKSYEYRPITKNEIQKDDEDTNEVER